MKNIQHSTFNTERPRYPRWRIFNEWWALNVECSMFLLSVLFLGTSRAFGQSGTNALPKLLPPYGPMPPTFWEQHGTDLIIVIVALALLAASVLWRLCRPKPAFVVPPEVQAREALARWAGRPEDGNSLSNISQILRRYFVSVFEFPAGEFTTAEFCRELERNKKIGPELTQAIAGFLRECDERKFSPAGSPASINAASRALELVALAEKVRAERDVNLAEK